MLSHELGKDAASSARLPSPSLLSLLFPAEGLRALFACIKFFLIKKKKCSNGYQARENYLRKMESM